MIKFTFQHSTQEISFLDMKIHVGADRKLSTTLHRKPTDCTALLHFHSNPSLKCKESIVFSQALRYNLLISDDTILQKELNSFTISLLARKYPLEVISLDTLLYRTPKASSSRSVLPVVTPYSSEGRQFSKSVQDHWHIIENDPQLHRIYPSPTITAYHKTESLKDIIVHSRQAKLTSPHSAPNEHRQ